jgi:large subunit ribosomal protein L6
MSRVGKKPIALPSGVSVDVKDGIVAVKGKKGELTAPLAVGVGVSVEDNNVVVERTSDEKAAAALHGTTRALVQNMVVGVSEGYSKKLEIVGVGFRAAVKGKTLILNIGFCHTVDIDAPEGITFTCPDQTHIEVTGIDKQAVGQIAAEIRAVRKPEPYKGKGIRYEGEQVRRKEGKSGK